MCVCVCVGCKDRSVGILETLEGQRHLQYQIHSNWLNSLVWRLTSRSSCEQREGRLVLGVFLCKFPVEFFHFVQQDLQLVCWWQDGHSERQRMTKELKRRVSRQPHQHTGGQCLVK